MPPLVHRHKHTVLSNLNANMASDALTTADKLSRRIVHNATTNLTACKIMNSFMKPKTLTEIKWIALDFSDSKLPNKSGELMPSTNKRILKHIAQYQLASDAIPENTWRDKTGAFAKYTCPLEVTMFLGGQARKFNLMDKRRLDYSQRYGIYIQMHDVDYPGTQACPTYDDVIKQLSDADKAVEATRAKLILEALDKIPEQQTVWETSGVFNAQQIRAAVELIALTHVAESAPQPGADVIYPADKLARSVLRRVASDLQVTFAKAFSNEHGLYMPAYKVACDAAADVHRLPESIQQVLYDMSDNSDTESA